MGNVGIRGAKTERGSEVEAGSGKRQRVDSELKHDHISSIACDPSLTSVVSSPDHIQRNQPCSAPSLERDLQGEVPSSKTTNTDGKIASADEECQNLHPAKAVLGIPDLSCGGEPLADPKAAPQVNPTSVGHEEYWVPVRLSRVQLEQYCATLIENSKFLCCNAKREALSGLHDILMTVRQCCDHPYLVDRSLERFLIKDRQTVDPLDTGIQVSGKLQLLTEFLPLIKERGLRVLILFQSCSLGKKTPKIGHILDDIMFQKFGEDSYVHVYPISRLEYSGCRSKKQDAVNIFNRESGRFVILMDKNACHPNIKISTVDIVILFNSDPDPLIDMKTLQKVMLQPRFGAVKVFRLFAPWTVEEKALVLAKQGTPIDSKLPQYSYHAYHKLLVWGVKCLFGSLYAFHGSSSSTFDSLLHSDEAFRLNVMSELSSVLSFKSDGCDADCSVISKVKACLDGYQGSISLHNEVEDMSADELPPHAFWGDLFSASRPVWKFLPDEAVKPRRGRQIDSFVADFNDGKETESETTKCRQVTDSVGLGTSLCSALGLRRKRNPRTKRDKLAASRFARFVFSAFPASPAKKSSDSEGECQKCSTPGVQSSSCLVNGADCCSHSDASSLMPRMNPEMLQHLHSCRKRKRFFYSADNNISTPGDSSSVPQINHEKSQSGLICGKRTKLVDFEGNNLSTPVDSIAETCGRRMIVLLQKQKEEYEDFLKIMRKENEMLHEEYQLELSLVHGETAAEQDNRAILDKKFKEKLVNYAHHMILKKKDLQARQFFERIYENSLRERRLNGQQDDSVEVAVECQRSGEVGEAVSAMFVPSDSNEVSPRCSATGPAALSTESNREDDLVVTAFLQTSDSYKKYPRDVFDLDLSKELELVSSSEKMNENFENVSEKEQETYTEHGDGPDKELLNEPAMGGDLCCLLGETSSGVLMDENCPSAAPLILAMALDSDHGVVMNPDKDDIAPRQQEVELSTDETPATETMETNLSSVPVDVEMSAGNSPPVAVQMSESNSPVAVEQPACSPRGETVPNTVPVSVPVTQSNGSDGVVNQDEVCVQSQVRNQALSSIVSSSSTPVDSPLCEASTLLASHVGHNFSTAARFESGTVNTTRPYQKQDPLRLELERLQREEEESVQKHDYKVLQAAYQKEMEELRKKYETMVKGVDDALLQKKMDIKRRYDVAFSHMLLADFSRLVANTPELSITGAPECSRESHSITNQSQQPPPQLVVCSPRPSSSAIGLPIQVVNRFTDLVSSDAIMTLLGTVLQPSSGGYQFQAPSPYLCPHDPVQALPCFPLYLYNGQFGIQPVQTWPNISNNGSRQIGYFGG
ncbi:Helicase protein MOM1-like protein [Drosera capensis]